MICYATQVISFKQTTARLKCDEKPQHCGNQNETLAQFRIYYLSLYL